MKPIALSPRLKAVGDFVFPHSVVADIGADHGQLILSLCEQGRIQKGYACENKAGPFAILRQAVEKQGLSKTIAVELADGISHLPETIDTVVVAGMGGELIVSILKSQPERLKNVKMLILAPNTDVPEVRKAINTLGFAIIGETMVEEKRHVYEIIQAERGSQDLSDLDLLYGPILRKARGQVFVRHWTSRKAAVEELLKKDISEKRREELQNEKERLDNL